MDEEVGFLDVLRACQVVVCKLGYGILSDCVAHGVGILFPPRIGFREDSLLESQASEVLRMRKLPVEDYEAGEWSEHLRQLAMLPQPGGRLETNGAQVCAGLIADHVRQGNWG